MEEPYGKHPDVAIEITSISTSKPPSSSPSSLDRRNDTELREHNVMTSSALENQAVDWTGPNDPEKPTNWPKHQKLAMIGVVTVCQFTVMLSSSMMSPALAQIESEFKGASQTLITFTVSIYVLGCALGPLALAPLSEAYGRYWVYHGGNIMYTVFSAACALSTSSEALLASRLLAGLAGSVPLTNAGGTIADMIRPERRGLINSIMGAALVSAPTLAPVVGGFLADAKGWRWIFWLMTILSGISTIIGFVLLRETYGPVLLQRRAARLRRETGSIELQVHSQKPKLSFIQRLGRALRRPMALLVASPILVITSLYIAFVHGITFILLTSMPLAFREVYGWSEGAVGLSSLGLGVGCFIGVFLTGLFSDRIYKREKEKSGDAYQPESRLFFLIPAAATLPTGIFIYGWTVQTKSPWIAPLIGTATFGTGLVFSFNAINNYIIDAFTVHAASAMAANGLLRGIAAALLPLSGPKLFERLGYGWGNTLLGLLAVGFGGASILLWPFGKTLRVRHPVNLE